MIRDATHADIPALLAMGERFAAQAGLDRIASYDHKSMARTFDHLIDDANGVLLIVEGHRGAAGGLVHPAYWNASHLTGQELFWWVEPDARGVGMALLSALENAARKRGAKSWCMIALEAIRPDATGRVYERMGYRPSERSYIKEL